MSFTKQIVLIAMQIVLTWLVESSTNIFVVVRQQFIVSSHKRCWLVAKIFIADDFFGRIYRFVPNGHAAKL